MHKGWMLITILMPALCCGCRATSGPAALTKALRPSNFRAWAPDLAKLSYAEFAGDEVQVHSIRRCIYATSDEYVVDHYSKTFRLSDVRTVDFIMSPFEAMPQLAHTMLSFGFANGDYLAVSVEIRKEAGEKYGTLKGFLNQYELMYVLGDERDIIRLATNYLEDDVYLYPIKVESEQARALFVDVLKRANKLAETPEFYHTLANNCTTNIVRHVNNIAPGKVPYGIGVLMPGLSDRHAYNLGLIDTKLPYEQARAAARINDQAHQHAFHPEFSRLIRENSFHSGTKLR